MLLNQEAFYEATQAMVSLRVPGVSCLTCACLEAVLVLDCEIFILFTGLRL